MGKKVCYFNITYQCNERCVFCAADSQADSKRAARSRKKDFDKTEFSKTLERIGINGDDEVRISGGEPSLHPDFLEIVALACQRTDSVWVTTTASYFARQDHLALLNEKHHCLFDVRLYAHRPEIHDKLTRTPGSFDRTVKGLKNLLAARKERGFSYRIGVRLLLARQTLPYLAETALFAIRELDVDSVCAIMLIESESTHRSSAFFPMRTARKEIERLYSAVGGDKRLTLSGLPLCILPKELADEAIRKRSTKHDMYSGDTGVTFHIYSSLGGSRSVNFNSKREEIGNPLPLTCSNCDAVRFCSCLPDWYWSKYGDSEPLGLKISVSAE
jgi:MoaA/NifB/PqqE/SkfB family radical SAM enzyme